MPDQPSADGVVHESHHARGLRVHVVGEAFVVRPRVDVQADGALGEGIGDAVDGVFALLQIDASDRRALDTVIWTNPSVPL